MRRITGRTTSSRTSSTRLPAVASGALGALANDWQISGIYRWSSGVPYTINYSIPALPPRTSPATTARPARASSSTATLVRDRARPVPADRQSSAAFAPPRPGSKGNESDRFFLHGPTINNLDLSFSKRVRIKGTAAVEIRFDLFNALNHTQWTGVNNTVNFASLTDPTITNLPYDSSGTLVNQNGFGTITGVRPPRTLQLVTRFTF